MRELQMSEKEVIVSGDWAFERDSYMSVIVPPGGAKRSGIRVILVTVGTAWQAGCGQKCARSGRIARDRLAVHSSGPFLASATEYCGQVAASSLAPVGAANDVSYLRALRSDQLRSAQLPSGRRFSRAQGPFSSEMIRDNHAPRAF